MKQNNYYPSQDPIIKLKQEMKLRGFSQKTVKSYLYYITSILKSSNKNPKTINTGDIRNYLEKLANKEKSSSTLNTVYSALKFYFEKILHRQFFVNIPRTKNDKKLPVVLSKSEIKTLLGTINNVKHKLCLSLMYSAGLRVSEMVNLKVRDLDFDNQILWVRGGKGNKDRQTLLPKILINVLKRYIRNCDLNNYVFESNRGGKLTERSIQKVFFKALNLSGIKKQATCHSLRHSFATHLLEQGTDIRYIQELLGHKRLETTQIYTKVTSNKLKNIGNPLDDLVNC